MIRSRTALVTVLALLLFCAPAWAQQAKTFAVLPFAVNGPDKFAYLAQGVQDMLTSRLTWTGKFQPMDKAQVEQKAKTSPRSEAEAKSLLTALRADFLVYGSMTIAGDDASLDVKVMDKTGQITPKSTQAKLNTLIPAMETVAKDINTQVFKRPEAPRDPKTGKPAQVINQMNPEIMVNQTADNQKTYLNPNFRYAGNADSPGSWRSQSLPFACNGMAIGDVDGDGKNEVVLISDNQVSIYRFVKHQLSEVAKWQGPARVKLVRVSVLPLGGDFKKCKIVVSGYFDKLPQATILSLEGNKLVPEAERLPYYLAAANLPPNFKKQLVGSRGEVREIFGGGVYEMSFSGGKLQQGPKLTLPGKANPFNFTYLPDSGGYKLVLVDDEDHLTVYTGRNDVQYKSEETFAGSSLGMEHDSMMSPLNAGGGQDYLWNYYYVPLPLVSVKLGDRKPELLVSKNISIAAQFFQNFRYFSQGEVHALSWDGVGLNLQWKTRRIKGTIMGYDVAEVEPGAGQALVLALNSAPGPAGLSNRRAIVFAYPLDVDSTKGDKFSNMEEVAP